MTIRKLSNDIEDQLDLFKDFKKSVSIAIFGSFFSDRKEDLIKLRDFLRDNGYSGAKISEDLDDSPLEDRCNDDPIRNRELSKKLIMESDIHIFIIVCRHDCEPDNLILSVAMELERMSVLDEFQIKLCPYIAVYSEHGLIETTGSVFKGLIHEKSDDWDIEEFEHIEDIFKPCRAFCHRSIYSIYYGNK